MKVLNKIQSPAGQITVEYILLAVALITLFQVATKALRENDYLKNFQDTPHNVFRNIVENGNWETDPTRPVGIFHPNQDIICIYRLTSKYLESN